MSRLSFLLRKLKLKKGRYSEKELNEIAGTLGSLAKGKGILMFSWNSVYDAFIKAGLSPEEAKRETDRRVCLSY
jgi:hypothetical protein